jgi:hypothetical protein
MIMQSQPGAATQPVVPVGIVKGGCHIHPPFTSPNVEARVGLPGSNQAPYIFDEPLRCAKLVFCCLTGARHKLRRRTPVGHTFSVWCPSTASIPETAESAAYSSQCRKTRDGLCGESSSNPRPDSQQPSQALRLSFETIFILACVSACDLNPVTFVLPTVARKGKGKR